MSAQWAEAAPDRYQRHTLIEWWDQQKLARARVLVAGAGALGNEVIKNIALLGIGEICVVDYDRVELTNLTRSVLFREADIGRPKAEVAAGRARELNPDVNAHAIVGDLELDLGLGYLREFDIAFGCLDSINARWALNRACRRAGVAWISAGIGPISGEVSFFAPDHPVCYECAMTPQMWERFNEHYSCTKMLKALPEGAQPTTAITASIAAAIQVQQALSWLHRMPDADSLAPGKRLFFQVKPYYVTVVDLPSDSDCLAHDGLSNVINLPGSSAALTPAAVFATLRERGVVAERLRLGFDLATGLACPACGVAEVLCPVKRLGPSEATCPACGQPRAPVLTTAIAKDDPLAERSLAALGIPPRPILYFQCADEDVLVELTDP